MMNIVIAIDSMKGCLTSTQASHAVMSGIRQARPDAQVTAIPVSDGGEGMLEAFGAALQCSAITATVHDPLMRPVTAQYGITPDGLTAVIETAQVCGLTLLAPAERDPLVATSRGAGELIADAMRHGCTRLIVGLGGSATVDGGCGMLEALGIDIIDDRVETTHSLLNGRQIEVIVAGDVSNPLCGTTGAARVFGPQKGATPDMVITLERRLSHLADLTAQALGTDHRNSPGAGAAGGMGFALMAYLNATMRPGADLLLDLLDFDRQVAGADLVITGEGSADRQTLMRKLPLCVMRRARANGVPTVLLAGRVGDRQALLDAGFTAVHCINPADSPLDQCLRPAIARQRLADWGCRLALGRDPGATWEL